MWDKVKALLKRSRDCLLYGIPSMQEIEWGGQNIVVYPGTIRSRPDYDDAWFYELARESQVIYDVGANVGFNAILAMLASPEAKVLLIEPNPAALSIAAMNMIYNGWAHRVRFVCAFAGASDGEKLRFWTVGAGAAGSLFPSHAHTAFRKGFSFMVETVTLDTLALQFGLVPDLVKIDVEGAESLVLEGSKRLAKENGPQFLVEMHHQEELPMLENARRILQWCQEVGYRAYYLKEHVVLENPDQIAHRGRCHLLLLPEGQAYPNGLREIPQGAPVFSEQKQ